MRKPRKLIVKVFRNLHMPGVMWSVRGPDGKILMHSKAVLLRNATFIVQPAGREKVRREKKKVVHAFVKGELVSDPQESCEHILGLNDNVLCSVAYNPYKNDEFVVANNLEIKSAESILITSLDDHAQLLAQGVTTE
tara:strand:+ start:2949 stop:3359 length:411 start_codon:yes stop_codon:yes gene_type:complete